MSNDLFGLPGQASDDHFRGINWGYLYNIKIKLLCLNSKSNYGFCVLNLCMFPERAGTD